MGVALSGRCNVGPKLAMDVNKPGKNIGSFCVKS